MAVLKKGSKGPGVKEAQDLLNKVGAKPKLTLDGLFGPLTDKQTRIFQKKAKTKVDGKIGEMTLATLKFGGALPVLPEIASDSRVLRDASHGDYAAVLAKDVDDAETKFSAMAAASKKRFATIQKMQAANVAEGKQRVAVAKKLISLNQAFEKNLKSNPKKSEKLLSDIDKLGGEWYRLYLGETDTNWRKYLDEISKDMAKVLKAVEKI